jgi:hypothetical protein
MDEQVKRKRAELELLVIKAIRTFENETGATVTSIMIGHSDNPTSDRDDLKLKIEIA